MSDGHGLSDRPGLPDGHGLPDDPLSPPSGGSELFREIDIQLLVHELKGPYALIEATTETLLAHTARLGPITARQERALKRIWRSAVRGRSLVELLLEVGRAEASQFTATTFGPAQVVWQVLLETAASSDGALASRLEEASGDDAQLAALVEAGIRLSVAPGSERLTIVQDRLKLELMVSNLIRNGLQYRRQALEVRLQHNGKQIVIVVQDDGPGIPAEYHATVFERYMRVPSDDGLERKGHGLGLAGSRILARRLGGDITLDSVPGQGATFRLTLPSAILDPRLPARP